MKEDKQLKFDETKHEYTYGPMNLLLTSVTQLLNKYYQPFDSDFHAQRISKKEGKTKQEILGLWEEKKNVACDFGTKIHEYAEKFILKQPLPKADSPREQAYFNQVHEYFMDHHKLSLVSTEIKLGLPAYRLAGTADLILKSEDGKVFLYDWKTSKEIVQDNRYKKYLLPPFNYLPDNNFIKYSLQLSMYKLLLGLVYGLKIDGIYVIHLFEDGYKEYKCLDLHMECGMLLSDRVNDLMKGEKKE